MFPGQLENIPAINVSWSAVIATPTERMTHNLCQEWESKDHSKDHHYNWFTRKQKKLTFCIWIQEVGHEQIAI